MPTRVVEPGEHLAAIAAESGFENVETIWNAPENAALRARRESPNQVLAGDNVFIPDKRPATIRKTAPGQHVLEVHVSKLEIALRLLDLFGRPLAATECQLNVDGVESTLTTGADGVVRFKIKAAARRAVLSAGDDVYELAVGALDPLPDLSGAEGRLLNLGYLDAPISGPDADEQLAAAVELFQSDRGLPIDGALTDETLAALHEAHGS